MPDSRDIDEFKLDTDAAWRPMFSPYHGKVVPAWWITKEARERMRTGSHGQGGDGK